ncbi:MAG TPA: PAS domain S-box protein [Phycisphaerae bacterium]|nr:PAS domain S-box protein [Phycisphaerae bacterium]
MKKKSPTYQQLEKRLAAAEPIITALKRHEVDAVVGEKKIAFLLLRRVEEAWLESHGEFSAMFDLNGIGMIQADTPAFRFTRVNTKFCEISGYTADELQTKTYIGLTHPEDRKKDLIEVSRVIRGKTDSWSIEKRCLRKDGRIIWVSVHGFALRDPVGRAVRILGMVEDITARKLAERQQREIRDQLKKQLRKWTGELSQKLRSGRGQVAKRKLADQVLRAIQEFMDRSIDSLSEESSVGRGKALPRIKTSFRKNMKSPSRRISGKPRPKSR